MITIIARRWFQKTFGNTYHSVEVYQDGKLLGRVPFQYGYGESYLQSAHDILAKNGIYGYEKTTELVDVVKNGKVDYQTPKESINKNEAYYKMLEAMREHRDNFVVSVTDVSRKKDL